MIVHERFEENLGLQLPGKVFRESGPSIACCILGKCSKEISNSLVMFKLGVNVVKTGVRSDRPGKEF